MLVESSTVSTTEGSAEGVNAITAGIALINSIGNLGGYVGPFIVGWIKDSTGSFEMGLYFLAGCAFADRCDFVCEVTVTATVSEV